MYFMNPRYNEKLPVSKLKMEHPILLESMKIQVSWQDYAICKETKYANFLLCYVNFVFNVIYAFDLLA